MEYLKPERLMKQCKLCPIVTEDAHYVAAIAGWRCGACDLLQTGAFTVDELKRQATPVDFNPLDSETAFVVSTHVVLENALAHKDRTTMRNHRRHVERLS